MSRTTLKMVGVLAAAAVAVPAAATAASPQVFSLGTALAEYAQQHGAVRTEPKVFSLGTALAEYAQKHSAQRASASPSPTASGGFDWTDAGIGGAVVGGVLIGLLGAVGFVRRRPAGTLGRT